MVHSEGVRKQEKNVIEHMYLNMKWNQRDRSGWYTHHHHYYYTRSKRVMHVYYHHNSNPESLT